MKGWKQAILGSTVVAYGATAAYSRAFDLSSFEEMLATLSATIALTGGTSPGIKFTLEIDTNGDGNYVAATTLVATTNGWAANAPTDPTITVTGKAYRQYVDLAGAKARYKYEVTGTPTGGSATIQIDAFLRSS